MGDYIEYAANSGYISDENFNIDEQIDYFIKVLRFLGNERIIAILYGNHDERMIKYTDSKRFLRGWAAEAGLDLDKVHVGEPQRGVTINLKVGDIVYTVYCIHGSTGATINKTSQLKRMATSRMASLLAHGHTHQILWEDKLNKVPTVGGEETRLQHWLVTGSFLKNASYGEKKSYPPSLVGAPIVRFRSDINDMNMWQLPYRSRYLDGGISSPLADIEGMTETFRDSLKVTSKVTTKPKKSKLTREQIREQYDSVIDFLKKRNT
jgi:predicted phosphodiesterase